jgi:hypothetical protein
MNPPHLALFGGKMTKTMSSDKTTAVFCKMRLIAGGEKVKKMFIEDCKKYITVNILLVVVVKFSQVAHH